MSLNIHENNLLSNPPASFEKVISFVLNNQINNFSLIMDYALNKGDSNYFYFNLQLLSRLLMLLCKSSKRSQVKIC